MNNEKRVICHLDLDCYYCQVESVRNPALNGLPMAVVQYNPNDCKRVNPSDNRINIGAGSIIAVNYEARSKGVKRQMRGVEARKACPEIVLVQVPTYENKANLTIYRDASALIVKCIQRSVLLVEKASVDEVYLDITEQTKKRLAEIDKLYPKRSDFVKYIYSNAPSILAGDNESEAERSKKDLRDGYKNDTTHNLYTDFSFLLDDDNEDDKMIAVGAVIIKEIRNQILELGFTCSAGVSHNKMLSKICSAMHKPNQQTLCFRSSVEKIMSSLPISRVPGWGGNLGTELIEKYSNETLTFSELIKEDKNDIINSFGQEVYNRILNAARGIDLEPVKDRSNSQQIGASKNFRNKNMILGGRASLETNGKVHEYLHELCKELVERVETDLEMHQRLPKQFICGFTVVDLNNKKPEVAWGKEGQSLSKTGVYPQTRVVGLSIEQAFSQSALKLIVKAVSENEYRLPSNWGISLLSLSATNFEDVASEAQKSLFNKFLSSPSKKQERSDETKCPSENNISSSSSSSSSPPLISKIAECQEYESVIKEESTDKKRSASEEEDLDMDVFNALPLDIQQEILNDRRNSKRTKTNDSNANTNKISLSKKPKELTIADKITNKEKQKGITRFFK